MVRSGYNLLMFNLQRLGNSIFSTGLSIITYTEFWAIELFAQIAKSLQIESVASNH